jgi:hypothetical protein
VLAKIAEEFSTEISSQDQNPEKSARSAHRKNDPIGENKTQIACGHHAANIKVQLFSG